MDRRPRLVLASGSPRRRDLLAATGMHFEIVPADVDETLLPGESAEDLTARLAVAKARAVRDALEPGPLLVIGADTVVVLDDEILGKPVDADDAARMLRRLSGRTHRVLTGVAVVAGEWSPRIDVTTTRVTFRPLTDDEIGEYVATGEPLDKAGAYGIQGAGGALVESIDGPYDNVVGLPVASVRRLLASARVEAPPAG